MIILFITSGPGLLFSKELCIKTHLHASRVDPNQTALMSSPNKVYIACFGSFVPRLKEFTSHMQFQSV